MLVVANYGRHESMAYAGCGVWYETREWTGKTPKKNLKGTNNSSDSNSSSNNNRSRVNRLNGAHYLSSLLAHAMHVIHLKPKIELKKWKKMSRTLVISLKFEWGVFQARKIKINAIDESVCVCVSVTRAIGNKAMCEVYCERHNQFPVQ